MDIALFVANLLVDLWLLIVLHRQGARKQLPWFALYVVWELLSATVGLTTWLISRSLYATVYWWKEGIRIALLVAAVIESLLRIFAGFKSLLRWSVSVVIILVVLYSSWKAIQA